MNDLCAILKGFEGRTLRLEFDRQKSHISTNQEQLSLVRRMVMGMKKRHRSSMESLASVIQRSVDNSGNNSGSNDGNFSQSDRDGENNASDGMNRKSRSHVLGSSDSNSSEGRNANSNAHDDAETDRARDAASSAHASGSIKHADEGHSQPRRKSGTRKRGSAKNKKTAGRRSSKRSLAAASRGSGRSRVTVANTNMNTSDSSSTGLDGSGNSRRNSGNNPDDNVHHEKNRHHADGSTDAHTSAKTNEISNVNAILNGIFSEEGSQNLDDNQDKAGNSSEQHMNGDASVETGVVPRSVSRVKLRQSDSVDMDDDDDDHDIEMKGWMDAGAAAASDSSLELRMQIVKMNHKIEVLEKVSMHAYIACLVGRVRVCVYSLVSVPYENVKCMHVCSIVCELPSFLLVCTCRRCALTPVLL